VPVRPKWGKRKHPALILADIAAGRPVGQFDAEFYAARDDRDLARARLDRAELGVEHQAALLRHDQQFAIGVIKYPLGHRAGRTVEMDADSVTGTGIAIGPQRCEAV